MPKSKSVIAANDNPGQPMSPVSLLLIPVIDLLARQAVLAAALEQKANDNQCSHRAP